jgi:hypothetical protein
MAKLAPSGPISCADIYPSYVYMMMPTGLFTPWTIQGGRVHGFSTQKTSFQAPISWSPNLSAIARQPARLTS